MQIYNPKTTINNKIMLDYQYIPDQIHAIGFRLNESIYIIGNSLGKTQ